MQHIQGCTAIKTNNRNMSPKSLRKCRSTKSKLCEKNGVASLNISLMRWNQLDSMLSESFQGTQNISLKAVSDTCPGQDHSKEGNNRCERNSYTYVVSCCRKKCNKLLQENLWSLVKTVFWKGKIWNVTGKRQTFM